MTKNYVVRQFVTQPQVARFLILFGVLWTTLALCTGCANVDSLFTTAEAVAAGIGVVLSALGAIIPAPIANAINEGITIVSNALAALKQAYDNYKAEPTNKTLLGEVENAVNAVKQALPALIAAAEVDNPTLKAWITNVVNAVSNAIQAVMTDIVPKIQMAVDAGQVDSATVSDVNTRAKVINEELKAAYKASLNTLPGDAAQAAEDDFNHRTHRHLGPIQL